jgi:hypothetical protein
MLDSAWSVSSQKGFATQIQQIRAIRVLTLFGPGLRRLDAA